ncbi:MAG TPA: hypothetical protein ENN17_12245 [bacterium]|nr:hypothetical protein [bacterium]
MTDSGYILRPASHGDGVEAFRDFFRIASRSRGKELLQEILRHYAGFPYENLSKIIKHSQNADPGLKMRLPEEVMEDHARYRLGGTCFALTFFLHTLLIHHGFDNYPVMADMRYGPNTHSALIVRLDGIPYLVDPGYLLNRPLELVRGKPRFYDAGFSGVELRYDPVNDVYELYTFQKTEFKWRYRFRDQAVPLDEFAALWRASFSWNGMHGLVLSRTERGRLVYVHKTFMRETTFDGKKNMHIRQDYHRRIHEVFGIHPERVEQALASLALNMTREREQGLWVPGKKKEGAKTVSRIIPEAGLEAG